jgi:hemerythrin-like domain-containing protein
MDCSEEPREVRIDAFLSGEHQRLDHILADVEFLTERRSYQQAAKRFAEFIRGVEEHIRVEDNVLLPLLIEKTGDPTDIAGRVHYEHERLISTLNEMSQAISRWDYGQFCALLPILDSLAKEHHRNEERILHPALDTLLRNQSDWQRLCHARHETG